MDTNYWEIGYQHLEAGRYDLAIANLEQIRPVGVEVLKTIGWAYLNKGEHHRAIQQYDQALRIEPNDWEIWQNRGLAHLRGVIRPRLVERRGWYVEVIAGLSYNRSQSHWKFEPDHVDQEYYQAIDDFNSAIALKPNEPWPWNNRGSALLSIVEDTQTLRRKGSDDLPNRAEKDLVNRAMADCNKAIEMDQRNSLAWTNRGLGFELLYKKRKAKQDYRHALSLDPGNVTAKAKIDNLRFNDLLLLFAVILFILLGGGLAVFFAGDGIWDFLT